MRSSGYIKALARLKILRWEWLAQCTEDLERFEALHFIGVELGIQDDVDDQDYQRMLEHLYFHRWEQHLQQVKFPEKGLYVLYCNEWNSTLPIALFPNRYKIGISYDIPTRFKQLICGAGYPLVPVHVIESRTLPWIEAYLHRLFDRKRIVDPGTGDEWFELPPDVIWLLLNCGKISKPTTVEGERKLLDLHIKLTEAFAPNLGPLFEG